jgi:hypothetical protein
MRFCRRIVKLFAAAHQFVDEMKVDLSLISCGLTTQRQMISVLRDRHMCEQTGASDAMRDRAADGCRPRDMLAAGASELRPNVPHDLEARRAILQLGLLRVLFWHVP